MPDFDAQTTEPLRVTVVCDYVPDPEHYADPGIVDPRTLPTAWQMAEMDQRGFDNDVDGDLLFHLMETGETTITVTPKPPAPEKVWWHRCGAWNGGEPHTAQACVGCGATEYSDGDIEEYLATMVRSTLPTYEPAADGE